MRERRLQTIADAVQLTRWRRDDVATNVFGGRRGRKGSLRCNPIALRVAGKRRILSEFTLRGAVAGEHDFANFRHAMPPLFYVFHASGVCKADEPRKWHRITASQSESDPVRADNNGNSQAANAARDLPPKCSSQTNNATNTKRISRKYIRLIVMRCIRCCCWVKSGYRTTHSTQTSARPVASTKRRRQRQGHRAVSATWANELVHGAQ